MEVRQPETATGT